ncbi:MAG: LexA family transcriptional regulator [Bacteroidetes bacterium]|nr:MAG: LexA family transcriptional regulator [Bacteroidota bacterium]
MSGKERDIIGKNLKYLRKNRGLTQQELADHLGIRRSSIGAYEECRATPKNDTLTRISDFFEVSLDLLLKEDLTHLSREELQEHREQRRLDIEGRKLRVLPITVDSSGRENIELVHQKASAGYLNGYADPEFIEELPKFQLPMLGSGTFRAFEIKGDSMLPLRSGSIIIGEYVQDWHDIKDGHTYVIVSDTEGVVYKRVFSKINKDGTGVLTLHSDNQAYPAYDLPVENVREVWKARMYLSADFPEPDLSLEKLSAIVLDIQQEMIKLKDQRPGQA